MDTDAAEKVIEEFIIESEGEDESRWTSSSSTSTSSSSDEYVVEVAGIIADRQKRTCIRNYFEEIVPGYTEKEFITQFRLGRRVFDSIVEKFEASAKFNSLSSENGRLITAAKHIAIFLWFAGHEAASFRDVSDRFNIAISTLNIVITGVSSFLSGLSHQVIKWPNNDEKERTARHYYESKKLPNVIGSVDGTHVHIDTPSESPDDYINRKGVHTIILQGICNEERRFIDIFIGYPGSVHDARVFRNSDIFPSLNQLCEGYYILGDSAYPCLRFCLTPYRDNGHLTHAQKHFNRTLSSCRVVIEHTFGILKQRFRQLYHLKLRSHERICHFIRACCVLHNIASFDDLNLFDNEELLDNVNPDEEEDPDQIPASGNELRDEICRQLFLRRL